MSQTRRMSLVESMTNTVVGFVLSVSLQFALMPLMGIKTTASQNVIVVLAFTVVSIVRGYTLRRLFNLRR